MLKVVLDNEAQGDLLEDLSSEHIPTIAFHNSNPIEIKPGKTLNINVCLDDLQCEKMIQVLHKYKETFAWEYSDMKGIDPQLSAHHIYIEKYV